MPNALWVERPIEVVLARIATVMSTAIKPYSQEVIPLTSLANCLPFLDMNNARSFLRAFAARDF
jgi:hypothetical protein